MAILLKKRDKYLRGHSYASGLGYNYTWTFKESEARRFPDDCSFVEGMAVATKSKPIKVENTRKELKELGRRLMKERERILASNS